MLMRLDHWHASDDLYLVNAFLSSEALFADHEIPLVGDGDKLNC